MERFSGFPAALLNGLKTAIVYFFTLRFLRDAVALARDVIAMCRRYEKLRDDRRGARAGCPPKCGRVPPDIYRRADPLIYSQRYLMEQGLSVTWDNPDIQLYENGNPVSSSSLKPGTDYEVRATIWNNSTKAPAVGLGVDFYFHDFGIGPQPIVIGTDTVTLPVKGAPGHPATARTIWRTPGAPGHYCLKVQLNWAEDANFKNNLGQENTNVGTAQSPAVFTFPVRNEDTVRRSLRLIADAYTIPPPVDCREKPDKTDSDKRFPRLATAPVHNEYSEKLPDWAFARSRHGPSAHPIPNGWSVGIAPETLDLDGGESQDVKVSITPPDGWKGRQAINVNALMGADLRGGVTLYVIRGEGG
ncbi:hypothetical protein QO034_16630 [Sedimentitalea sp. JM2-8]|uniref:CARDB domain-containing protein n=1 Tax=Sedimentitalea xiamensis TaxID=3050037 RepID=A0ABT7FHV5_9RHOB|nr:hypothetical protein [Sedimentitalea xiamensis]MDK3074719.1 hypothetical protein [Sedimentitalea xiamensis]